MTTKTYTVMNIEAYLAWREIKIEPAQDRPSALITIQYLMPDEIDGDEITKWHYEPTTYASFTGKAVLEEPDLMLRDAKIWAMGPLPLEGEADYCNYFHSEAGEKLYFGELVEGKSSVIPVSGQCVTAVGPRANRGYVGYSMSERAAEAYESGQLPKSKWTKKLMLERLNGWAEATGRAFKIDLAKMPKAELFKLFFYKIAWHHTSKMFNETGFYTMDDGAAWLCSTPQ